MLPQLFVCDQRFKIYVLIGRRGEGRKQRSLYKRCFENEKSSKNNEARLPGGDQKKPQIIHFTPENKQHTFEGEA